MPKYVVVNRFRDLKDNEHVYEVGETFPREGEKNPTKKRIEELTANHPYYNAPLIAVVEDDEDGKSSEPNESKDESKDDGETASDEE